MGTESGGPTLLGVEEDLREEERFALTSSEAALLDGLSGHAED